MVISTEPRVTEVLAEHIVSARFEDLPPAVITKAKDLLAYHLALAYAGRATEHGKQAITIAHQLSGGGGAATIVGERRRATLLDAVFAHVELIDPELDARHIASKTVPNRVADPVIWVIGEREHATGREAITALVLAFDVACRLGELQPHDGDYSRVAHKCAFAPFAVATVAARLLGYDAARTARVLGRAAHCGAGLNAGLEDAWAFSAIARSALVAALVPIEAGGALLTTIDGPHGLYSALFGGPPAGLGASLATLGREFPILTASIQPQRGSASHTAALEAGRMLFGSVDGDADIESVLVVLPDEFRGRFAYQETRMDRATDPRDERMAAARSLRLKMALLFTERVVVAQPSVAQFRDPRVQATTEKVRLAFERLPFDRARVEVRTRDGRLMRAEGSVSQAAANDGVAWRRSLTAGSLASDRRVRLERLLSSLEDVADVGEVLACTRPDSDE